MSLLAKYAFRVETFAAPEIAPFGESSPLFVVPVLNRPSGIIFDRFGNLVVATDFGHQLIRISSDGTYDILSGSGVYTAMRPNTVEKSISGAHATFRSPSGLSLSPNGDILVADSGNRCVRKVLGDGTTSLYIGSSGHSKDDHTTKAQVLVHLSRPVAVCCHQNTVYVADQGDNSVRKLTSDGMVQKLGQSPFISGREMWLDGPPAVGSLYTPIALCASPDGSIYVTQDSCNTIRVIRPNDHIEAYAGSLEGYLDGPRKDARFFGPAGIICTPLSELLVADRFNHRIRLISSNGIVTTLSGSAESGMRDGPSATFDTPFHLCLSPNGQDLYISDHNKFNIRRILNITNTQLAQRFSPNFNLSRIPSELLQMPQILIEQNGKTVYMPIPLQRMMFPSLHPEKTQRILERLLPQLDSVVTDAILRLVHGTMPFFDANSHLHTAEFILVLQALEAVEWAQLLLDDFLLAVKLDLSWDISQQLMDIALHIRSLDAESTWTDALHRTLLELLSYLEGYPRELVDPRKLLGNAKLPTLKHHDLEQRLHRSFLHEGLQWLYNQTTCLDPIFPPDFLVICDGISVNCHKWLVASRWTFLQRALQFPGLEVDSQHLDLSSKLPSNAIHPFVKYLYTNDPSALTDFESKVELLRRCQELDIVTPDNTPAFGFEALLYHVIQDPSVLEAAAQGDLSPTSLATLKESLTKIVSHWL